MGIVNLKWHKACAISGMGFTKEEQAAGWPESFALHRLAILQSPADKKMANFLHRALIDACANGSLPNAPAIVRRIGYEQKTYRENGPFVRRNVYGERELDYRTRNVPVMKDVEVPAVNAADFADWLTAQDETPSEHIAAWFDAVGVDTDNRPIAPPAGWQARTQHGLLRFNGTDGGRLVLLADLVGWIMESRELPCKPAVEAVCNELERNPRAGAALFLLRENDYAQPLTANHSFFSTPLKSFWDEQHQGNDSDKGVVGAVKYMRQFWGDSPAPGATNWIGQDVLDPLAIRLDVAFRLWGYGHRADEVKQADVSAREPASWTPLVAMADPAPQASPHKLSRRDLLAPLIERAQGECSDTYDAPAVYAALTKLAKDKVAPLIGGVTEDGIQWADEKGDVQCLSLKNLRERLNRRKKAATQPQKAPLKRVK